MALRGEIAGYSLHEGVDVVCDAFEEAWLAKSHPQLEEYLALVPERDRETLFGELAKIESFYRRQREDAWQPAELHERFPQFTHRIDELERSVAEPSAAGEPSFAGESSASGEPNAGETLRSASDDTWRPSGLELPGFPLLELLGRGAFGVVYRARDEKLDREVAVKFATQLQDAGAEQARFQREAWSAARLSHPGIVPVFDVGVGDSGPYMISEYVPGPTLKQAFSERTFSARESAELVEKLADAVHYAHQRGVIHRDLKPSNILLQGFAVEHRSIGQPRIVDFGLARLQDAETLTATGELLGTPAYMSPEQVRGAGHAADARSDIYSLGVILYEALGGQAPHRGSVHQVLHAVAEREPEPVRRLRTQIPRDLAVICHKCLAKQPADRYATAADVAADLGRWLDHRPILARPLPWWQHATKRMTRYPLGSAVVACLLFFIASLLVVDWRKTVHRDQLDATRAVARWLNDPSSQLEGQLAPLRAQPRALDPLEGVLTDEIARGRQQVARAQLALLPSQPQWGQPLAAYVLEAADADEMRLMLTELRSHTPEVYELLPFAAQAKRAEEPSNLRALVVCLLQPEKNAADPIEAFVRSLMRLENAADAMAWLDAVPLARRVLVRDELLAVVRDEEHPQAARMLAAQLLGQLWGRDPQHLLTGLPAVPDHYLAPVMRVAAEQTDLRDEVALAFEHAFRDACCLALDIQASAAQQEAQWRVAAILAVWCLQLDAEEAVWSALAYAQDPRLRVYLAHLLPSTETSVDLALKHLRGRGRTDADVAFTLVSALAGYPQQRLSESQLSNLLAYLQHQVEHHPDAGMHGICWWALRCHDQDAFLETLYDRLAGVERPSFTWRVNRQRQCLITLEIPASGRFPARRVEVSAREVTWQAFRALCPEVEVIFVEFGDLQHPAYGLLYFEALDYCDALTQAEFPSAELLEPGTDTRSVDLRRPNYRPITSHEWTVAGKADARTATHFGSHESPLRDDFIGGFTHDELRHVGRRPPNRLGFFDMLDNLSEYTSDRKGKGKDVIEPDGPLRTVHKHDRVMVRGARVGEPPRMIYADRMSSIPVGTRDRVRGIRLARTLDFSTQGPEHD